MTENALQPVLPPHEVQLGLDTFGDMTVDEEGRPRTFGQVLREVVEQGVLADEVGVDAIGLGEHHRDDFAISAPEVVRSEERRVGKEWRPLAAVYRNNKIKTKVMDRARATVMIDH